MKRVAILGGLLLAALLAGYLLTNVDVPEFSKGDDSWEATIVTFSDYNESELQRIAGNGRWDVLLETSEPEGPTGEFNQDFKLVAIVNSQTVYALLQEQLDDTKKVNKVMAGDLLTGDWMVTEILETAVIATRDEEIQRVELFAVPERSSE